MGQYYTPIIKINNKYKGFLSFDYGNNGLKLMEHSYVGNLFVETVVHQLLNTPSNLAWVGDYSEEGDVKSELANDFIEKESRFGSGKEDEIPYSKVEPYRGTSYGLFLINHTKKQFIDMATYMKLTPNKEWPIHPLPLLTAIGNGKGGGDYRGSLQDWIGNWACDLIEARESLDTNLEYQNITTDILFEE